MNANIIITSFNALKQKLLEIYPTIQIYINELPENMVKPCFLFKLSYLKHEETARWTVTHHITWQLFYYADKSHAGSIQVYDKVDELNNTLIETQVIHYNDASFKIDQYELGLIDNHVCTTITLETQTNRTRPEYENMVDIKNTIKGV